jgi:hypothetical protein
MVKNTYGTGCFMLMHAGATPPQSHNRLLATVGWTIDNRTDYLLEGSVFMGGATVQWLRDGLGIIKQSADVEALALSVPDSGGVMLVPAFVGLGAPHWDAYARGTIVGMTRGTTAAHIARAAVEAIAYQSAELLAAMQKDADCAVHEVRADGGASRNDLLDAVPGRPAGRARRAPAGDGDDGPRRRLPRRSRGRLLVVARGDRGPVEGRAPVRAAAAGRAPRRDDGALVARGGACVSVLITVLAVQTGWKAVGAGVDESAEMAIEAIGLLAIAVVSLQIAQTITEEEVVRDAHISAPTRVRRYLSRFMVVVVVALSIEGLVGTFKALHEEPELLPHAASVLVAAALLMAGWGVFIRMNKAAEEIEPEAMEAAKSEDAKVDE